MSGYDEKEAWREYQRQMSEKGMIAPGDGPKRITEAEIRCRLGPATEERLVFIAIQIAEWLGYEVIAESEPKMVIWTNERGSALGWEDGDQLSYGEMQQAAAWWNARDSDGCLLREILGGPKR